MGVRVLPSINDRFDIFHDNATGWHVDDDGRLHIRGKRGSDGAAGNIATYNKDMWFSVEDNTSRVEASEKVEEYQSPGTDAAKPVVEYTTGTVAVEHPTATVINNTYEADARHAERLAKTQQYRAR
ncbi:MAG: hypothetical protein A2Y38_25795 [Spirochaetes bacterium GWB1_59_5]|nr:MAG: hypothetical protein A2Y38_25795 [Spirochaetes bacterium GWB1_59_5]